MTDELTIGEQRKRAGVDGKGRHVQHGRPVGQDEKRVIDRRFGIDDKITVVGDEERVDLTPEEADRKRAAFEDDRRARAKQRQANRSSMPLHFRLEHVMNAVTRLQAPRARAIASAGSDHGAEARVLPPGGHELELAHAHPGEVARRMRDIDMAVGRLEELLDAHRGLGVARDYAMMDAYEKNAIILTEFVGMRPEEVTAFEPMLGTPRTIRYVRTLWAADDRNRWQGGPYRGVCGHVVDACDCAGARIRKAPRKEAA